jgi:hypothetical protein
MRKEVITKETHSPYCTNIKTQHSHIIYTGQNSICSLILKLLLNATAITIITLIMIIIIIIIIQDETVSVLN